MQRNIGIAQLLRPSKISSEVSNSQRPSISKKLFWSQVPLARYLMMFTDADTTTFHFLAPQKGTYLLDIFASTYPTYEMCQKQEATKYINVCRFKVNCADFDKVPALGKLAIDGYMQSLIIIFGIKIPHSLWLRPELGHCK